MVGTTEILHVQNLVDVTYYPPPQQRVIILTAISGVKRNTQDDHAIYDDL